MPVSLSLFCRASESERERERVAPSPSVCTLYCAREDARRRTFYSTLNFLSLSFLFIFFRQQTSSLFFFLQSPSSIYTSNDRIYYLFLCPFLSARTSQSFGTYRGWRWRRSTLVCIKKSPRKIFHCGLLLVLRRKLRRGVQTFYMRTTSRPKALYTFSYTFLLPLRTPRAFFLFFSLHIYSTFSPRLAHLFYFLSLSFAIRRSSCARHHVCQRIIEKSLRAKECHSVFFLWGTHPSCVFSRSAIALG